MLKFLRVAQFLLAAALAGLLLPAQAAERLVSADWLKHNLGRPEVLVLDASPPSMHRKAHIVGAVSANMVNFGPMELSSAAMEKRLRGWGVSPGQQIVISDEGGSYWAPKLFWDLLHYGVPAENLHILDGGLAKWQASGGAVTQEPTTPRPAASAWARRTRRCACGCLNSWPPPASRSAASHSKRWTRSTSTAAPRSSTAAATCRTPP